MKIWIPGIKGLLGTALSKTVKIPFIGTGRKEADITDMRSIRAFLRSNPGITHIVNCAAYSQVDLSESNREEAHLSNAIGPENLATVANEIGARLIHISTDYVFPGNVQRPLKEDDLVGPTSFYGKTKLEGEERVQWTMPSACVLRVSWLFGNGGKNFVSNLVRLLQEKKEIQLTSDQWGRPTYVPDLAETIVKLLDASGLYHFANAGATTKYEFGLAMKEELEALGVPLTVQSLIPVPGSTFLSPCKRPAYSAFDTSKIERHLKITPRPWRAALREFLEKHAPAAASR